jgi:NTE family protein
MYPMREKLCWVPLLLLLTSGCAPLHYPVNAPLEKISADQQQGYYMQNTARDRSDDLLVFVSFSGGGTRAAAFAYGVMEVLAETPIVWNGDKKRLLDEVDIFSGVSGGSFPAAYYGLFGDRIFEEFLPRFLKYNIQGELTKRIFSPSNWPGLGSPLYGRSDLAAEYYDERLFEGKTFADILARGGPAILVNATDATLGTQFTFDQVQFDLLCSDVAQFPVSRAVTASSAVPVLFSSVTLRNYAGDCEYVPPDWARGALRERETNSRRFHQASQLAAYRNRQERPYIHLYDGGLADNLGVRPLLDRVSLAGDIWKIMQARQLSDTRKLVVIVVNSQTAIDTSPNRYEFNISLLHTVLAASSVPLDRYSFETLELLESNLRDWKQVINQRRCESSINDNDNNCRGDFEYYLIQVDFDAIADEEQSDYLKQLATSFYLPEADIDLLRDSAARILNSSREFNRLIDDLGAPPATDGDS